jgi:hypothetical protein
VQAFGFRGGPEYRFSGTAKPFRFFLIPGYLYRMAGHVNAAADYASDVRFEPAGTSARRVGGILPAVESGAQAVALGARLAELGLERRLSPQRCCGEFCFQSFDLLMETVKVLCDQTDRHGRSNLRLQTALLTVYIKNKETPQVSGFRVQEMKEGRRRSFRHPPAWAIGAGGDQAPATAFLLNPEP